MALVRPLFREFGQSGHAVDEIWALSASVKSAILCANLLESGSVLTRVLASWAKSSAMSVTVRRIVRPTLCEFGRFRVDPGRCAGPEFGLPKSVPPEATQVLTPKMCIGTIPRRESADPAPSPPAAFRVRRLQARPPRQTHQKMKSKSSGIGQNSTRPLT